MTNDNITVSRELLRQALDVINTRSCDAKYEQQCNTCQIELALRTALEQPAVEHGGLDDETRLGWDFWRIKDLEQKSASPPARPAVEPVTDEENELFSEDVSNFAGADPEATKYALGQFLKRRSPSPQAQQPAGAAQFNAAIDFAITQGLEAATFLDAWRHGDTSEWPEFEAAVRQKAGLK